MAKRRKDMVKRRSSAEQRNRCMQLYLSGIVQHKDLAAHLGVSPSCIARYLRDAEEEWHREMVEGIDRVKARQLKELEWIRCEAKAAWQESKKDAEATKVTIGDDGEKRVERATKGQCGNPAFLAEIRATLEREAKLLGIDQPTKHAMTTPDGKEAAPGNIIVQQVQALSDEQLEIMVEAARIQHEHFGGHVIDLPASE